MKPNTLSLILFTLLTYFAVAVGMKAVVPTPDGGYPNFTTAEGQNALFGLTSGAANTAAGWFSLKSVTTGSFNTGVGAGTLAFNTADSNTAVGAAALLLNTTGTQNTAVGTTALPYNNGDKNTAVGAEALASHQTDGDNSAFGFQALNSDQSGFENSAFGSSALLFNVSGHNNTAVGVLALSQSTGSFNTAIGYEAGAALTAGNGNVYIGAEAGGGGNNESNHTYISNVNNTSVSGGNTDFVTVDLTTGLMGHLSSSRRYKEQIKPMDNASETLYRLKPVTYHYKKEIDQTQSPSFGLIAEDVAEVNPSLVARNSKGEPESVHYEMVNSMLLNEFLKEHRRVQELEATVAQQRKDSEVTALRQQKQIEALTAIVQKVSAQLEVNKPAPQTAQNTE